MAGRAHFEKGNRALGRVSVRVSFEYPARKARFHFSVNPRFYNLPKLFSKIRDLIEPGKFEGFE